MIKWLLVIAFLWCCIDISQSQTSWEEAQKTKKAQIEIYHINVKPFIYKEEGEVKGLEAEIIRKFAKFVKQKYAIDVTVKFQQQENFGEVYQLVKGGYSGAFAASTFSVTPKRKKEVQFSPVYMPDIEILVSSSNLPVLQDTSEVTKHFRNVTAVVVPRSTTITNFQSLSSYLPGLTYKRVKHFSDLALTVAQNKHHVAYVQLSTYLTALQKNLKIKRQNLFQINKEGRAIVLPKNSDWKEPIDAFFQAADFKPWVNEVIKRYFGNDVKDLIWQLSDIKSENNKNVLLLTKEKEFKELELVKKQLEIDRQTLLRNIFIIGIIAVFIIAFFIYNRYQTQQKNNKVLQTKNEEITNQKQELIAKNEELQQQQEEILSQQSYIEKKNTELERKNKEVENSIQAAEVFQKALLPYYERMQIYLEDFFVIYRPKDIVSGDFYWLNHRDDKVFLAAVDCTGHGVPGALLSMISYMILDKLVMVDKLNDPAEILNRCHASISNILKDHENAGNYGMDMAFLILDKLNEQQTKITFSGAKSPLLYIPAGGKSIQEIRGNRRSIGGFRRYNFQFSNHELTLDRGSLVYLSTDGYADQNNSDRKKYGKQQFRTTLKNTTDDSLEKQKKALEKELDHYMFGTNQRDDILVIGFKV